jgi:hypothetical protein
MKIFNQSGTEILDVLVDDSSVRYRSIMNDDSLTLNFSLTESIEIPLYSYVVFEGSRYTLWRPEEFKKNGTRNHEYTLTLHGYREFLKFVKFKDTSAKPYRLKFFLTGKPVDFMNMLVDSLNDKDGGWTVGSCIDASEKTLSFNHEYCLDVLARLATEFNTEYEFEGKKIHLRKVEKFKDDPLPLSYGKGNGFLPGVGRYNDGDKQPIVRLYVQGGERNIDFSNYGSKTLLLPKSATLEYGGKTYRTDADGMYITRDGNNNTAEDSFDAGEIYPSRVGTVTAVEVIDAEKNFYDIIDSTIPEALDYGNCRIAGEKATIVFQTGALAGREFDIEQTDDAMNGYVHDERRFKIVPAELDGIVMPGGVFVPTAGDKYAVFNICMPEAYISDDATKTGASWDMFREAVKYFAENETEKFRFTGEMDGIWSKSRWLEIGGKIVPGGHVLFSDTQFQPQGVLIRIIAVKDYVNKPHKPEITLSNASVSGSFSAELGKLEADEVVIEESKKEAIRFTKRQWRDARETILMLEQSLLRFSGSINPITVQTMQLLVGDESLQFRFVNSKTNPQVVAHNVVFDPETKVLTSDSGILQHMTLGISTIQKTHAASEYKYWDISAYTSPALDPEKAYYLYAKCGKTTENGSFLLSETAIGMDSVSDYYHFLVGILNSEQDGDRSFARMYGFTEILPGQVTTDRIVSQDGLTYFDLLNGIIAGKIRFLSSGIEADLDTWAEGTSQDIQDAQLAAQAAQTIANAAQITASDALAKANTSKAITDKFGTTVNGGLINTVTMELREAGTQNVTAFISGLRGDGTLPAFGAGGTYEDALNNLAKIIFRHNGTGKIGVFDVDVDGKIRVYDIEDSTLVKFLISQGDLPAFSDLNTDVVESHLTDLPDFEYSTGVGGGGIYTIPTSIIIGHDDATITFNGLAHIVCEYQVDELDRIIAGQGTDVNIDLYKKNANGVFVLYTPIYFMQTTSTNPIVGKVIEKSISNVPAGEYRIGIGYYVNWIGSVGLTGMTLHYSVNTSNVKRTEFGRNGFMQFYNNAGVKNFYYMTESDGLKIGGATDIPGVLLAGEVGLNGGFSSIWGAKKHATNTATKPATGQYTVYHSIGHTDYQVQVTPTSANRTCYIVSKSTDNFVVYFYSVASSPVLANTGFNFSITGRNY